MAGFTELTHAEAAAVSDIRGAGGVVRSSWARERGHSKRTIARLVDARELVRLRRVWLALPDADPLARAAARAGAVVSCVTQAKRVGLWVLEDEPPHVAVAAHRSGVEVAPGTTVHWDAPLVPRPPGMLFDGIENVLALVARCLPSEQALTVVESALNSRRVDREVLLRLPIGRTFRDLLEEATPWSDSGIETLFVRRLRWLGLPIRPQVWIAGHRVDFLIGDRLVVQIDGGHHIGAQRDADIAHDGVLLLRGYHVIRVSYQQIVREWHVVQDLILHAVAEGLHRAS